MTTTTHKPLSRELADDLRAKARKLEDEAKDLLKDAAKLRRSADQLAPARGRKPKAVTA